MRRHAARTLAVLGSGGHTGEMIALLSALPRSRYTPVTFVTAATDKLSEQRAKDLLLADGKPWASRNSECMFCTIPRAREVGQSWISTIWTTLGAFWHALKLVHRARPDVLLVNGPGTCLPLCVASICLQVLGLSGQTRIIFVESFCR